MVEYALVMAGAVLVWCVVGWIREPSRRLPIEGPAARPVPIGQT